jgi:sugar-phosphatase
MITRLYKTYSFQSLLFDMDGTLVDSTPVVERTWQRFAKRHALNASTILAWSHGRRTAETVAQFAPAHIDLEHETAKIVAEEIADIDGITAIAGAKRLLYALPEDRWALVTSASRELAIRRMLAAALPIPKVLISAEDVIKGKPAPDGYLVAAKTLGASPKDCLVFEDTITGLKAAHAAGMRAFAIGPKLRDKKCCSERWLPDFSCVAPTESTVSPFFMQLNLT